MPERWSIQSLPQANIPIAGEPQEPKVRPDVAIGWGALALLLVMLAALLALAPKTVVSVLPGAAELYAMLGKPVRAGSPSRMLLRHGAMPVAPRCCKSRAKSSISPRARWACRRW